MVDSDPGLSVTTRWNRAARVIEVLDAAGLWLSLEDGQPWPEMLEHLREGKTARVNTRTA